MGSSSNPLTGASWGVSGSTPQQNNLLSVTGPAAYGTQGLNSPAQASGAPTSLGNPGGFQNPLGSKEINRNMGLTNIMAGQMKNQLAPQFAQLMSQYGNQAGNYFSNLMNLGSPYYQQKQTQSFNQGVQQGNNADAMARQQLNAQGYGATPSGAQAAMIGGMQQQQAQSQAEQYLQNLFQNEQMQSMGAQGLAGMAGMYNPSQLLGGTSVGANIQDPSSFFQNFATMAGGINSLATGYGGGR